ncbi:MAG: glycoside hydrolase family 44 protein, partial [Bacillota bacterium]
MKILGKKIYIVMLISLLMLVFQLVLNFSVVEAADSIAVEFSINTEKNRTKISPYIYGSNQDANETIVKARRLGGNRTTGYNWENNFSNAGDDWNHSSDTYMLSYYDIPEEKWEEPGVVATRFHDISLSKEVPYSLMTLQASGYVAADDAGNVFAGEVAPSSRWKEVKFRKGESFSLNPDLNDDKVYMDEFVNFLVSKYGTADDRNGIKGYSIDNEPGLWASTHPRIHPEKVTCDELVNKSRELATAVKDVDPTAEIFGPALYGFNAYLSLQDASDWQQVKDDYRWFIDYYLSKMKDASEAEGRRLLDVLDLHWYPEAKGGGERIIMGNFDPSNTANIRARVQAPRTLWDSTYSEDSWIANWHGEYLPLLPNIKKSIE